MAKRRKLTTLKKSSISAKARKRGIALKGKNGKLRSKANLIRRLRK